MYKKLITLAAVVLASGTMAFSNTTILVNTDFNGFDGWIFGANRFQPKTTWLEFVTAPDAFPYADRVTPNGGGFDFKSWDDGIADKIEAFVFQEYPAGPAGSPTESMFATGDVIVFKGSASATRVGNDTSDMVVRAFIKTLGYNELGWAFQTKPEYSSFQPIGSALESFELSVTFPDLAVDDSLQVLQLGLEITTEYDGSAMDSGTIYFENLEGYIEGEEVPMWAGYTVDENGFADTGSWLGMLEVSNAPWIWADSTQGWIYIDEDTVSEEGSWTYFVR